MNSKEQRNHRTALQQLRAETEEALDATVKAVHERIVETKHRLEHKLEGLAGLVNLEIAARSKDVEDLRARLAIANRKIEELECWRDNRLIERVKKHRPRSWRWEK